MSTATGATQFQVGWVDVSVRCRPGVPSDRADLRLGEQGRRSGGVGGPGHDRPAGKVAAGETGKV